MGLSVAPPKGQPERESEKGKPTVPVGRPAVIGKPELIKPATSTSQSDIMNSSDELTDEEMFLLTGIPTSNESEKSPEVAAAPVVNKPPTVAPVAAHKRGLSVAPPQDLSKVKQTEEKKDLDEDELRAGIVHDKDITINQEEDLNLNDYRGISALTAEDIMNKDYNLYFKHLEEKTIEVKEWLQDILSENGKTTDIAEARKLRGAKYVEMKSFIDKLLVKHFAERNTVRREDAGTLTAIIINEMLGLGPIEPLWLNPEITEIMVNGPFEVWVEIRGKLVKAKGARFRDRNHLLETAQQILAPLGKTIDMAHPYEDGRLVDKSRINVTHPIIGEDGPFLTIRRFPETVFTLKRLVEKGSMTEEMAVEIGNLIYAGCSTIVAGGTGTGKTSMLNALSGCIPGTERIITIEDNLELRLNSTKHVVAMEARKSHQKGENSVGNVSIRDLVKNALRQRPDRIVVGEVRDGSAYDMLQAMNTGHEGSMTTVHANDPEGAIDRLVNLIGEGDSSMNDAQCLSLISNGVDIMVTIARFEDGSRKVASISEIPSRIKSDGKQVTLTPRMLYEFVQTGINENDEVVGVYEKREELSESIIKKHRLNHRKRMTIEDIYEVSEESEKDKK
jgi:pilus assembly protein CpaF